MIKPVPLCDIERAQELRSLAVRGTFGRILAQQSAALDRNPGKVVSTSLPCSSFAYALAFFTAEDVSNALQRRFEKDAERARLQAEISQIITEAREREKLYDNLRRRRHDDDDD